MKDLNPNTITASTYRDLPLLDTVKPIVLRDNRWRCDHGWDIDLDDSSTNYRVYNNLALNGAIKLREGSYRDGGEECDNSFHPHVWFTGSQDIFRHYIVFEPYRPIRVSRPLGK